MSLCEEGTGKWRQDSQENFYLSEIFYYKYVR